MNTLVLGLQIYTGYKAQGLDLGLAATMEVAVMRSLGFFISITPGGLGIMEAILVLSSIPLGVKATQGLALAVVIRLAYLFWAFLLGPIFSFLLLNKPVPVYDESPPDAAEDGMS